MTLSLNTVFRVLVPAALLAAWSSSCSKQDEGPVAAAGRRVIVFDAGVGGTKAEVTAHERDVETLDLLVFRADDGKLDAYSRTSGTRSISASLTEGKPLRWHVVANAPEGAMAGFASESAFLSSLTTLSDCTWTSLVMHGEGTITVTKATGPVSVNLLRYVSKVSLGSIEMKYLDGFTTFPETRVGRVGLINVVGSAPLSGIAMTGSLWYNRQELDPSLTGKLKDILVADTGLPGITSSERTEVGVSFYCMPNPVNNGVTSREEPSWSPRNTRLAVEVIIDGESNWYGIPMPSMQGNTHYVVDRLTILGPGASGPDYPAERVGVEFDVRIADWETNVINTDFFKQ